MFNNGKNDSGGKKAGKNKYTPGEALKELRAMRKSSGILLFSSTSEHGPLPNIDQIKSFWDRLKTANRAKKAKRAKSVESNKIRQRHC